MEAGGEGFHRNRTQEVAGSSPASSTRKSPANGPLPFPIATTKMAEMGLWSKSAIREQLYDLTHRTHEVAGSSPASSIRKSTANEPVSFSRARTKASKPAQWSSAGQNRRCHVPRQDAAARRETGELSGIAPERSVNHVSGTNTLRVRPDPPHQEGRRRPAHMRRPGIGRSAA